MVLQHASALLTHTLMKYLPASLSGRYCFCCSLFIAALQVLAFVQQHTEYQQAQLAGNSVHVDRVFLQRRMPELLEHLHYRIVDVSTVKELCRCAGPGGLTQWVHPHHVVPAGMAFLIANPRAAAVRTSRVFLLIPPALACCTDIAADPQLTILGCTCCVCCACRRWRPRVYRQAPRKVAAHTAMSDIKESLKELQYYKQALFRGK